MQKPDFTVSFRIDWMGISWAWKTIMKWRAPPKIFFKAWLPSRGVRVQDKIGHICMFVGRCQWRIQIDEREEIILIEQVPRGTWDLERVDGLALDRNRIYIHVPLQIIL